MSAKTVKNTGEILGNIKEIPLQIDEINRNIQKLHKLTSYFKCLLQIMKF